jgi:hypothetical protein
MSSKVSGLILPADCAGRGFSVPYGRVHRDGMAAWCDIKACCRRDADPLEPQQLIASINRVQSTTIATSSIT